MPNTDPPTGAGSSTADQFIATLRKENNGLRTKRREDKARIEELEQKLKDGGLPEGAVVLKPDEAKVYEAFKALKLEPAKVQEALTERDTLKTTLAERDRDALHDEIAESEGYNRKVLRDQVKLHELHLEMRDVSVEEDGKTVTKKVAHVRPAKDEKAQLEPLAAYAERELKEYLPALKASETSKSSSTATRTTASGYPPQRPTGSSKGTPTDKKELAQQKHADMDYSL